MRYSINIVNELLLNIYCVISNIWTTPQMNHFYENFVFTKISDIVYFSCWLVILIINYLLKIRNQEILNHRVNPKIDLYIFHLTFLIPIQNIKYFLKKQFISTKFRNDCVGAYEITISIKYKLFYRILILSIFFPTLWLKYILILIIY